MGGYKKTGERQLRYQWFFPTALGLVLSFLGSGVQANNAEAGASEAGSAIDRSHAAISERFTSLARGVDHFFAGNQAPAAAEEALKDDSYLRLQLRSSIVDGGENRNDVRIKARFAMPGTKQRLRLVFDSDSEETRGLAERNRAVSLGDRVRRDESQAGLELAPETSSPWQRKLRVGVRLNKNLDGFVKYRLRRTWDEDEFWTYRFEQSLWYYDSRGWGETSEFQASRPIWHDWLFSSDTEVEYRDENNFFDAAHTLSLVHSPNARITDGYRFGFIGDSEKQARINQYFFSYSHRRQLGRDWAYVSLIPELTFARQKNWRPRASVTINFDFYFH